MSEEKMGARVVYDIERLMRHYPGNETPFSSFYMWICVMVCTMDLEGRSILWALKARSF